VVLGAAGSRRRAHGRSPTGQPPGARERTAAPRARIGATNPLAPPRTTPPARLKLHKGWWSAKEPAAQVTVVTGLNPSRLNQLEAQCKRWRGPLSAAVYQVTLNANKDQPLPADQKQKLDDAAAEIDDFHAR
jgi:hypothetical protein